MNISDDEATAAITFLDKHPGWSYRDFMDAPVEIVKGLQLLDLERARALKRHA